MFGGGLPDARHQAEEKLVRRNHLDHPIESWLHASDVVHGSEGHAGHHEHWSGGHARRLHGKGACGWLREDAGSPGVRHQANRRLSSDGIWIITLKADNHCILPDTREGHAVHGGHGELCFGGHARTLHVEGVCGVLQEDAGFPAARHRAEQRLDTREHLDHPIESWKLLHLTRHNGVHRGEGPAVQGGHVELWFAGHARMLHFRGVRCWLEENASFPAQQFLSK